MAATKRQFYIVDLIRKRSEFVNLEVPAIRVNITIEVSADVPKAKMDRLEKAARESLDKTEDIITETLVKHEKQCAVLVSQRKWGEAMTCAKQVDPLIKKAGELAQTSANKAVEDMKKAEAHGDKLLLEARVKTTVTFIFGGVKIATSVTRIAASHGADVHAWVTLVQDLYKMGKEIQQQLKDEPALKKDLIDGVQAYIELRGTMVMQAAIKQGLTDTSNLPGIPEVFGVLADRVVAAGKELTKGRAKADIAKDVFTFVFKGVNGDFTKAEKARVAYRNHTIKMRQQVDNVSKQGDKLFAAMKKASTLKEGVKIGAHCMQLRGQATRMQQAQINAVKFLDEQAAVMEQNGLKINDQTVMQKIKALDFGTIFSRGSGIVENVMAIKDLVDAVSAAVA